MSLKPIMQQPSLAQIVADQLRSEIMSGAFRLGENISEDRLVKQLGVSRTPIREALYTLSRERLVVVRPKRGTFVFETSAQDIDEICDYREILETAAFRRAMLQDGEGFLDVMEQMCTKMRLALGANDYETYGHIDSQFHLYAFECSGNDYLREAYDLIFGRIAALRSNLTASYEVRREESFGEHCDMIGCLSRYDMRGFEEILSRHIGRTGEVYRLAIANGDLG
jgi:DNA-binding GntR family transcriptional regulator